MPEVAECPVCGEEPSKIQFSAGGWGYRCCGHESMCLHYWNRYAAAMVFTMATIKNIETAKNTRSTKRGKRATIDDLSDSNEAACNALKVAQEVFR